MRQLTTQDLHSHKDNALSKLEDYLNNLISSVDPKENSKADKLSYWLEDWAEYLAFERNFSPLSLRRYKRGEIIKVHLGFNIGSEEGGLHYALVLDKNNSKSSPVITVVPLTSVKPDTNLNKLRRGNVFLGNELFVNLNSKASSIEKKLISFIETIRPIAEDPTLNKANANDLLLQLERAQKDLDLLRRMRSEISKMKTGSIALVNQIRTISKIRIYDPKTDHDILSGIKLSDEKLDVIDNEIIKLYIKSK